MVLLISFIQGAIYAIPNPEEVLQSFIEDEGVSITEDKLILSNLKGTVWIPCNPISKVHSNAEDAFFELTRGFIFLPNNQLLVVCMCWDFIPGYVRCYIDDIDYIEDYTSSDSKIETDEFLFTKEGNRLKVHTKWSKSNEELFMYKTIWIMNDDKQNPSLHSQGYYQRFHLKGIF